LLSEGDAPAGVLADSGVTSSRIDRERERQTKTADATSVIQKNGSLFTRFDFVTRRL
jgi:hypothetical protein